jgi:PAS domain S-box-containing protein
MRRNLIALGITILAGLAVTWIAWRAAQQQAENYARLRFDIRVAEVSQALRGRMIDYEQVLRGAVGLFAASVEVDRGEWAAYVATLELQSTYPGIRALGYAPYVRAKGAEPARAPVKYLEPLDEVNRPVIGLDLYAERERRTAMERARDTAEPVATARLVLLQDRNSAPQPAFLVFLPVYKRMTPASLAERRAEITGFVYGAFRVADLMRGTLGETPGVHLRLLDMTERAAPVVLFESDRAMLQGEPRFATAEAIIFRGRTWRLEAGALPSFHAETATDRPLIVLGGGLATTLLLAGLMWSLLNTQARARELARRMTAAHQELDRFRVAVDRHWDTMLMVDADRMRIVYANEGACRALGYRREELLGQPPEIVFADRDGGRLSGEYRQLAQSQDGVSIERGRFRRKDGTEFPVEISREVMKSGDTTFVLGVARDITARLEAERAIRESEGRLTLALESSGLALFDWDLRSGLVHLGKEWNVILGGAPQPSVTPIQKLDRLVHADDRPALEEGVRKLLRGEIASYRLEQRVQCLDGQWKWIESVAKVSERDAAGRAVRVTGTNADISERKAVGELKNAFIANVSHELRTPLAGIIASVELLKEGAAGDLPAQAMKFVEMAHGNGERLAALISDILDLERIESGRLSLNIEPIDAGKLLEQATELNAAYAARYKAALKLEYAPGLAVAGDRDRLLQVLTNLISNAAKFSPEGGAISVQAKASGRRVRISVSDQGPGIPEAFRAKLFGKFEQAQHDKGGTGLGLAITKAMVEKMGGEIGCDSTPGQGATFWLELPAAES